MNYNRSNRKHSLAMNDRLSTLTLSRAARGECQNQHKSCFHRHRSPIYFDSLTDEQSIGGKNQPVESDRVTLMGCIPISVERSNWISSTARSPPCTARESACQGIQSTANTDVDHVQITIQMNNIVKSACHRCRRMSYQIIHHCI